MKYLLAGLILLGCAAPILADEPQWLIDARAKEGKLGAPHTETSADQQVSFAVPVPLSAPLKEEKTSYTVAFQLGPNAVAACNIFKDDIDVASTLRGVAATTFSGIIEPAQGKIEQKALELLDAGVVGATPFLSVAWVYRVNDGKGAKLGELRQFAASQAGHGVYCALNDLGYAKTFEQVVRAMLLSLKTPGDYVAPYYQEVSVASMRAMKLGYSSLELRHDKDNNTFIKETTVALIPAEADELRAEDMYQLEWAHPDGGLIHGSHVVSSNGEVEENLNLKAGDNGIWQVGGQFKGKEVKEDLSGTAPSSWLAQTHLMHALLAKDKPIGTETSFTLWLSADPGRFTESTAKVLAAVDASTYSVRETAGTLVVDLVVDQGTGLVTSGTMQVGPSAMKSERIFVQGTP